MNIRTIVSSSRSAVRTNRDTPGKGRRRLPSAAGRPALYIAVAAAGALVFNVVTTGDPSAKAAAEPHSVSVAQQLGLTAHARQLDSGDLTPLEQLAASRSERVGDQAAAMQVLAAAEQAEQQRQAAAAAAAAAAQAEAARQAAAQQAQPAQPQAAAPAVSVDPGSIQGWTASYMSATYGWGSDQMSCLVSLWNRESRWNMNASNPSSGAYGIPQALPGSKMASAGADWRTNPETQVKWGLGYIKGSYGTPCGAWGHSQSNGWY